MCIPSVFYPFLIKALNFYTSTTKNISKFIEKVKFGYETAFIPRVYAFCKGYAQPVLVTRSTNMGQCELFYDVNQSLFYSKRLGSKPYSLPILSIEIIDTNGETVYDLTNYIENMKFIDVSRRPSIAAVVMIWATLTNNFLDPEVHKVRYIDMSGDECIVSFSDSYELQR
jgi:hypothetical protein